MKNYKVLSLTIAILMFISSLFCGTSKFAFSNHSTKNDSNEESTNCLPEPNNQESTIKNEQNKVSDISSRGLTSVSSASWSEGFDSESEMNKASDIIICGVVIDTETELRHDIVFTRNYIKITKADKGNVSLGDVITVLQTGGTYSKYTTPAISEIPLLNIDKEYKLYLTLTEYSEKYGQYYLISGGYQGVLEIQNNGSLITLSDENTVFNKETVFSYESASNNTRAATPTLNYYWNQSSLLVYVQGNIRDLYHSNTRTGICNGINAWADKTDSPTTSITATLTENADVCVYMQDYGATGWDAETTTYYDINTNICSYSRMLVNANNFSGYYDMEGLWQAIACHEFGHTLGLNHNDSGSASIMRSVTTDYFNYRGLLPRYKVPKKVDITSINTKY